MVIAPLSVIYFASIFPLLLIFWFCLWWLWWYGISTHLCCKIYQSEVCFWVVGENGVRRRKILHSSPFSVLCLLFDFEQNPLTSLNFNFARYISSSYSTSPQLPRESREKLWQSLIAILNFTVTWIHWWTLRSVVPAQILSGTVLFGSSVPCLWHGSLFPGVFSVHACAGDVIS